MSADRTILNAAVDTAPITGNIYFAIDAPPWTLMMDNRTAGIAGNSIDFMLFTLFDIRQDLLYCRFFGLVVKVKPLMGRGLY